MTGFVQFLHRRRERSREAGALESVPTLPCDCGPLRPLAAGNLTDLFESAELGREWSTAAEELARVCRIEDGTTGGVNPGDRRAVWHLVRGLNAAAVLEVGTHVGASTLHIAAALRGNRDRDPSVAPRLVTVDIADVNASTGPWRTMGLAASPKEMLRAMGCDDFVTFRVEKSVDFLDACTERFDFIFLDGDHAAKTVYQEVPRALRALAPGGVILLHDYFPGRRPLWADGSCVLGPHLAVARLQREGAPLKVLPLGELPWPTKLGSRTTSLAVLTRDGS